MLDLSNETLINNKRNSKQNQNYTTIKDTTVDSINNSVRINNDKNLNYPELQQVHGLYLKTMDEKYDKYKNLENPFTVPDMPRNVAKERRTRIIKKINKERMQYQSKSVDNISCENQSNKKRNSHLENNILEINEL